MVMRLNFRTSTRALGIAFFLTIACSLVGSNSRATLGQELDPFADPVAKAAQAENPDSDSKGNVTPSPERVTSPDAAPKSSGGSERTQPPLPATATPAPAATADREFERPGNTRKNPSRSDVERLRILEEQILELSALLKSLQNEKHAAGFAAPRGLPAPAPVPGSPAARPPKPVGKGVARGATRPSAGSDRRAHAVPDGDRAYKPVAPDASPIAAALTDPGNLVVQSNEPDPQSRLVERPYEIDASEIPRAMAATVMSKGDPDVQVVTITRSQYKLPAGLAEALAVFLAEQLNDEIEVKVTGDTLQVTAAAQDQRAITSIISLFLRRGRALQPTRDRPLDRDNRS